MKHSGVKKKKDIYYTNYTPSQQLLHKPSKIRLKTTWKKNPRPKLQNVSLGSRRRTSRRPHLTSIPQPGGHLYPPHLGRRLAAYREAGRAGLEESQRRGKRRFLKGLEERRRAEADAGGHRVVPVSWEGLCAYSYSVFLSGRDLVDQGSCELGWGKWSKDVACLLRIDCVMCRRILKAWGYILKVLLFLLLLIELIIDG